MKKFLWTAIGLSTIVGGVVYYRMYSDFKVKQEAGMSESIKTVVCASVQQSHLPKVLNTIGTLQAFDSVQLKAEIDGKIKAIHFKEGVPVLEDELLIELDDSRAVADLKEAEAMYRRADREYKPAEKLAKQGVVAELARGTKKEDRDAYAARVEHHKVLVEKHKIRAPFAGVAGLRNISVGEYVSPGKDLVKIVNGHPLRLSFKVPELNITDIAVGQKVEILADGVPGKFLATILAICPESDTASHSFEVKAILDSDNMVLRPGMFVRVEVLLNKDQGGLIIQEGAVHRIGNDEIVYKIVDGYPQSVRVNTGLRKDGYVEIRRGVRARDVLVIKGYNLQDGSPVKIVELDGVKQKSVQLGKE